MVNERADKVETDVCLFERRRCEDYHWFVADAENRVVSIEIEGVRGGRSSDQERERRRAVDRGDIIVE
jgi:hypothetical protein